MRTGEAQSEEKEEDGEKGKERKERTRNEICGWLSKANSDSNGNVDDGYRTSGFDAKTKRV